MSLSGNDDCLNIGNIEVVGVQSPAPLPFLRVVRRDKLHHLNKLNMYTSNLLQYHIL